MGILRMGCRNHPRATLNITANFCTDCGSPLEELTVEACAQCGERRFGRFCPFCGHEHEGHEATVEEAARAG